VRITGCRVDEALTLRYRHVIDEGDKIIIRFEITKSGEYREVPLNWPGFSMCKWRRCISDKTS